MSSRRTYGAAILTVCIAVTLAGLKGQDAQPDRISGIGAAVVFREGILTIQRLLPDSPAQRAGLLAGDQIVAVDGQAIAELELDQAVALLRGTEFTPVRIDILRNAANEPVTFTVLRETVQVAQ